MRSENSKIKRLRIFAGPNGSGKTTIIKAFPKKIPLGYYVNADDIEKELVERKCIDLTKYGIKAITKDIQGFIQNSGMSPVKLKNKIIHSHFKIRANKLYVDVKKLNSYLAADIAEFIRQKLIESGNSFSFETVLSHPGKLNLLKKAKLNGYKIYLYYVATNNPEINVNRVGIRVAKKGHPVEEETIKNRYYRSLEILLDTIKLSNRCYLFDNSGKYYELVAEITEAKKVTILDHDKNIPEWFITYVYNKISKKK